MTSPADLNQNPGVTHRPLELLAPAGGHEQLEYAVHFGADAVYLATERFGMRRNSGNFKIEDLPATVAYAHDRNVKVHVACNVSMRGDDLVELPDYLRLVEKSGADALIVADLGALRLARRHAPNLELHVSTQANVTNAEAASAWYELGARRVVCARELSLAEIAALRAGVPDDLELEVFAHGSMCMAYSGRCLISDHLTGRGANEGNCTQPCRWGWTLHERTRPGQEFDIEEDGRETYLFNSRDLNMLAHLEELAAAGVNSIKLEGRGRKAFYVATVVNAYRQVLDGASPELFAEELERISHHPYGTGFFFGPAHQAPDSGASEQTWEWVAAVASCEPDGKCGPAYPWEAEIVARNRFDTESELEVLSPGKPVRPLRIANIRLIETTEDGTVAEKPVTCANRQMDRYRMACSIPLEARDIVRARKRRSEGRQSLG